MPAVRYRGSRPRTITGPATGKQYACRYGQDIEVEAADLGGLLRMRKPNCNCGHLFRLVRRQKIPA